nr:hypothetical protein [Paracoccus saliphilus]
MNEPRDPERRPTEAGPRPEPETGPTNPRAAQQHPGPAGGAYGSRGPVDGVGDPVTPGEAHAAETASLDRSAGEAGAPADMDYYRTSQKSGTGLALMAVALPIALLLLVIVAVVWFYR